VGELVRFRSNGGSPIVVEVDEDSFGVEGIARESGGVIEAGQRLDQALMAVGPTLQAIVTTLRGLVADEHEIEFGIKLNAEAGVVIAKTALEGHFNVKVTFRRSSESQERTGARTES
jgi:Trypsin-co-occurring domain 1